jgi:hypothetical protein
MKKALIITIGLIFGIFMVVLGLFEYAMYRLKPVWDVVAVDIDVTQEWQDFSPAKPLRIRRQTQRVDLNIVGYKFDLGEQLPWKVTLQDGTVVNPEVQVIDEYGNTFEMQDSTRVGDTVGLTPARRTEGATTFPNDRTYTKVRIRSDVPFRCSSIVWTNKDLK